jgi:hypothetical protein
MPAGVVVNSHYYAEIDPDQCTGGCVWTNGARWSLLKRERMPIGSSGIDASGLQSLCQRLSRGSRPADSQRPGETGAPPLTEEVWFDERGKGRGVDFLLYK